MLIITALEDQEALEEMEALEDLVVLEDPEALEEDTLEDTKEDFLPPPMTSLSMEAHQCQHAV